MSRSVALLIALTGVLVTLVVQGHGGFDLTPVRSDMARKGTFASSVIEWRINSNEAESTFNLLIHPNGQSQLLSYASDVTVGEVLQSRIISDLKLTHTKCALQVASTSEAVPATAQFGALLQKHAQAQTGTNGVELVCHRAHSTTPIIFAFQHYVKPHYQPNEIRSRNMMRRALLNEEADYPIESAELIGDNWAGILGWALAFLKWHWGTMHPYLDYTTSATQTGRWHLNTGEVLQTDSTFGPESDQPVRIAISADWAAGTREADYVQQVMMNGNGTAYNPHWTVHVGDVYFLGSPELVQSNVLGIAPAGVKQGVKWPWGSLGTMAVQGNHEAYARSIGFFDYLLPTFGTYNETTGANNGQDAGFLSLENKYWRIIHLDTGYNTYAFIPGDDNKNNTQPQAVIDWLVNVMDISNPSDTRGIIFLSHHQVISAFGSPSQATPNQIAALLPPGKQVIWLWGHEHRLSFYKLAQLEINDIGLYGRCIGNGGFPSSLTDIPPRANSSGLAAYDNRFYELETGFFPMNVTYNGFVHLDLDQSSATITYSTLTTDPTTGLLSNTLQTDLVQELFEVDENGDVQLSKFAVLDPELTVINDQ